MKPEGLLFSKTGPQLSQIDLKVKAGSELVNNFSALKYYQRIEILNKEKLLKFIIGVSFDLNAYFEHKSAKMKEKRKQHRTEFVRV